MKLTNAKARSYSLQDIVVYCVCILKILKVTVRATVTASVILG